MNKDSYLPPHVAYMILADAAYLVHQAIWFYGENHKFPSGLTDLPRLDARLSYALSQIPYVPGVNPMSVHINAERRAVEVGWTPGTYTGFVTLRATSGDDVSTTLSIPNDGRAPVTYPAAFHGTTHIEVIADDGTVIDSGDIDV